MSDLQANLWDSIKHLLSILRSATEKYAALFPGAVTKKAVAIGDSHHAIRALNVGSVR